MSAVSAEYVHVAKRVRPGAPIELGGAALKWYDVAPAGAPMAPAVASLARDCLEAEADTLGLAGELGFVILHRCGTSFYFLLVTTWRNENELWETVWAKDGEADPRFRPWPAAGTHRPTFCVWELGAVAHEREAWSRYLRSARDEAAAAAYLADTFAGEV